MFNHLHQIDSLGNNIIEPSEHKTLEISCDHLIIYSLFGLWMHAVYSNWSGVILFAQASLYKKIGQIW